MQEALREFGEYLRLAVPGKLSQQQYMARIGQMVDEGLNAETFLTSTASGSTFNARRSAIQHLLKFNQRTGKLAELIPAGFEMPSCRHGNRGEMIYATPRQMREMFERLSLKDRVASMIFLVQYAAGLRREESRQLQIGDVVLEEKAGYLVVREGKGGQFRLVNFDSYTAGKMERYLAWRTRAGAQPTDWLFIGDQGGQYDSKFRKFIELLEECYREVGLPIPNRPCHNSRRMFGTHMDEAGASVRVIQDLLGHKSLATTERYIGVTQKRKREAVERLAPEDTEPAGVRQAG